MKCFVPCCNIQKNSRLSKIEKRRFHKFPINNEALFEKWKEVIFCNTTNIPDITRESAVCSVHFRERDYAKSKKTGSRTLHLKKNTVPSIGLTKKEDELDYLPVDDNETEPLEYFDDDSDSNPFPTINNYSKINFEKEVTPVKVFSLGPVCDIPACRKGVLDQVALFDAPKPNKGQVTFKNKDGTAEVMDRRTAWLKLAHLTDEDDDETKEWKFCSLHFLPKDFRPGKLTNFI